MGARSREAEEGRGRRMVGVGEEEARQRRTTVLKKAGREEASA